MTYTRQLKELLNELKLARGKNCLIFIISRRPARLKELIASKGFDVREIYLRGRDNLLAMLLTWNETTENTLYLVHGIGNQFPWVLPYLNLHRDLFFDIKRPIVVVGNEYEIKEIQKHAPDWFRFRSRTYELKEGEEEAEQGEDLAGLAELYYPLPVFVAEESEEEIKERIKIDEYLLSSVHDDYKLAELYMSLSLSYFKLRDFEHGEKYLQKSNAIREELKDDKGILLNYTRLSYIFIALSEFEKAVEACNHALKLNSNLTEAYYNRGLAYGNLKQYESAIADFSKAIELNPEDTAAYYNRGVAYADLKQYESAIEDYSKAIELNPNLAEAYMNRGLTYSRIGRYEESSRDLKHAGILFFYSGRVEDSAEAFSSCFKLPRDKIASEDVIYSGLALLLITKNRDIGDELKRMRMQAEPMRKIFELALMKLQGEDISRQIALLEEKEKKAKTDEMMLLFDLLKQY
ncbi:MAG: tetratricopeptide repeat protein [Methanophagales archaeon]|nr:tetratricopeptide repeat protein [Methanophagales archaeon]